MTVNEPPGNNTSQSGVHCLWSLFFYSTQQLGCSYDTNYSKIRIRTSTGRYIAKMNPIEVLGNVLLFTLVFAMSATVDIDCMKEQLRNKKAILLGVFCQFFLLPFLGFATVNLLNLSAPIGITLLVVTSSPGGSYSSWYDMIDSFM
jgi:hypothetical protein